MNACVLRSILTLFLAILLSACSDVKFKNKQSRTSNLENVGSDVSFDAPTIVEHPTGGGDFGEPFEMNVVASGENLKYQWMKNGDPIPGEISEVLSFEELNSEDNAFYSVSVSNEAGSVTSDPAFILVSEPAVAAPPPEQRYPYSVKCTANTHWYPYDKTAFQSESRKCSQKLAETCREGYFIGPITVLSSNTVRLIPDPTQSYTAPTQWGSMCYPGPE